MGYRAQLRAYWVKEGIFMAGAHPAAYGLNPSFLTSMVNDGIGAFIDLTEPGEGSSYEGVLAEISAEMEGDIRYHSFPIRDFTAPSVGTMISILDTIDETLENDQGVYVHCMAGIGRTGTVVGCWLVRHGLSPRKALSAIEYLRGDGIESPESDSQIDLILDWERDL